jgi:uncharacterized membrane protein YfcA
MFKVEIITFVLCVLAALLHGLSGFGFPMISTAALSMFYPLPIAVAMVIIPCLILNLMVLHSDPERSFLHTLYYYLQKYWVLILSSLIGSFIGVILLLYINENYLKFMMGLVILLYVLDQLRAQPIRIQQSLPNMLIFGCLAGVIGGATNAMAPFLMMYLLSTRHQKTDIVMISNLSFLASKIIQLGMLYPTLYSFQTTQIYLLLAITLAALGFVYLGSKIRAHLSQQKFKRIILTLLTLLGANAIWQAVTHF